MSHHRQFYGHQAYQKWKKKILSKEVQTKQWEELFTKKFCEEMELSYLW